MRRLPAALLALALLACREDTPPPKPETKPPLALLTGLPWLFGEGFTLDAPRHPALARLERGFEVTPVDGPEQLPPGGLLLAAQPRALTAERLVALDRWVRAGGRLLLLADPRLSWESELPLGDSQRPPYEFADTGLLANWGLSLEAPAIGVGESPRNLGGAAVPAISPGRLVKQGGDCRVSADGFLAQCRIGRGHVFVVADADFAQGATPAGVDAIATLLNALRRA